MVMDLRKLVLLTAHTIGFQDTVVGSVSSTFTWSHSKAVTTCAERFSHQAHGILAVGDRSYPSTLWRGISRSCVAMEKSTLRVALSKASVED